ncbi:MAG: hypothetical protein KY468_21155, partial [Armatimonadetes bacterium]|nr:hypothetical protein [Armatimonadota bacterium]
FGEYNPLVRLIIVGYALVPAPPHKIHSSIPVPLKLLGRDQEKTAFRIIPEGGLLYHSNGR